MKKIKLSFAIGASFLMLFSCKKASNNTSTAASGGSSSNTTISASNATSYYGIFSSGKTQAVVGGVLQSPSYYSADAYFASAPVYFIDWSKAVTVDSVKANARTLKYVSAAYEYEDTTNSLSIHNAITFPITWHVVGKNGIPSFTYTDNPFPSYTGFSSIPDTINHSTGFTFPLTGVSGVTGISVLIDDGSLGHWSTTMLFQSNATNITVSATDMAQLLATNTGNISITFNKKNVEDVYGKAMNFQSTYTIKKVISIK